MYGYVGADAINRTDPTGLCGFRGGREGTIVYDCPQKDRKVNNDSGGGDQSNYSPGFSLGNYTTTIGVNGCAPGQSAYDGETPTVTCRRTGGPTLGTILAFGSAPAPRPGIIGGAGGGSKTDAPQKDDCAYKNSSGQCVYVKDKDGKLKFAPDYQKQVCANFAALQDGAARTNDGLTAVGIAGGTRGGMLGTIIGGLSTFGAFISSITTGAGYRPFGWTIIPKSALPPGC